MRECIETCQQLGFKVWVQKQKASYCCPHSLCHFLEESKRHMHPEVHVSASGIDNRSNAFQSPYVQNRGRLQLDNTRMTTQ